MDKVRTWVEATKADLLQGADVIPQHLLEKAKKGYSSSGKPQVFLAHPRNKKVVYAVLFDHYEVECAFVAYLHRRKPRQNAEVFLEALKKGKELFRQKPFEIRHMLMYSHYVTLTMIERKTKINVNRDLAGSIGTFMELVDATSYDYTAETGRKRGGLSASESSLIPSRRFKG